MALEHHDLAHEFPEFKARIHELKMNDAHFKKGGFNPEVHNSTEIGKVASYL